MNSLRQAFVSLGLVQAHSPASTPEGEFEGDRAGIAVTRGPVITLNNVRVGDVLYRDNIEIGFVEAIHPDAIRLKFTEKERTVCYFLDHAPAEQHGRIKGLKFSVNQCQKLGLVSILGEFRCAHFNPREPRK